MTYREVSNLISRGKYKGIGLPFASSLLPNKGMPIYVYSNKFSGDAIYMYLAEPKAPSLLRIESAFDNIFLKSNPELYLDAKSEYIRYNRYGILLSTLSTRTISGIINSIKENGHKPGYTYAWLPILFNTLKIPSQQHQPINESSKEKRQDRRSKLKQDN